MKANRERTSSLQCQHDIAECVDAARSGGLRLLKLVVGSIVQARRLTVAETFMFADKVLDAVRGEGIVLHGNRGRAQ